MDGRTSYEIILTYLPPEIRRAMKFAAEYTENLSEIRMRSGRAVSYVYPGKIMFLTADGSLTTDYRSGRCICVSATDIHKTVEALCRYSVHSCKELQLFYVYLLLIRRYICRYDNLSSDFRQR